ncbi:helix-turn-helix domain-containing protein [Actinomadura formosensis]|uniref:helix-turn-helix domain-containing protein n=1 Tax=Actinomadura formosensis TaxID=60706 RepID=UPI003D8C7B20
MRQRRGLSQTEAARKIRVDLVTLQRWELGKCSPQPRNIVEISRVFQVSILEVERWFGMEPMPSDSNWCPDTDSRFLDGTTLTKTMALMHDAYREGMGSAGLTRGQIAAVQAYADLYIKGFKEGRNETTSPRAPNGDTQ